VTDALTGELMRSDRWTFTAVDGGVPMPDQFDVQYQADTLVEYVSTATERPALYRYSHTVDTDALLAERLTYAASKSIMPQNCATAALKHAASELGKPISDSALSSIITPDGQTSLYDMKKLALGSGLYCRAVQTDLASLAGLSGVQAILHIPGRKHFVLLDVADDRYVWIIDLSSDKFYYRASVDFFPLEWSEGVALLLSDRPMASSWNEIDDTTLSTFVGSETSGGYACTQLIQTDHVIYCNTGMPCGTFVFVFERYGCEPAASGSCMDESMVRFLASPCVIYPPGGYCVVTYEWTYYYIRACL